MSRKVAPLQTERLTLRRISAADAPAIHGYMCDPEVTRWLPSGVLDEAGALAFAEKNAGRGATNLALIERASGELIGHMSFHRWFAPTVQEIGWAIGRPHQGRGYATEAARALMSHAFEGLRRHRVLATCQPENGASWRVMEKLGMRREAHFRKVIAREAGVWWDEYVYAILAEEYFALR